MSYFRKVILQGTQDSGTIEDIPVTAEGHMEVAIHSPRLPFGSIHTESLTPEFQSDAVYGINTFESVATTGIVGAGTSSGTATSTNGMFTVSTGTTALSFGTIQSRKRLRYRAGQGVVGRTAGFFSAPAASAIQVIGFGTGESGFYFGYNGTDFGVLHSTGGIREIQTLTVTTASTATNNYVVTLNGIATTVTATNNGSTTMTAYEISKGTYPGWSATQRGATVIFLSNDVGNKAGAFTLAQTGAGTPAVGSFAETLAGVDATNNWVAQTAWNGDKLDGTGPSGYTMDKTKGNVFQIGIQYLGFGTVTMGVEVVQADGNNADFVVAHTFKFPNTLTAPHSRNPSFPFTMAAYSGGSTTNVSVSAGSYGGFIEGQKKLTGPRMTYFNTTAVTSSTSAYTPIFTVRNERTYTTKANQAVVNLLSIGGAAKSVTGLTSFYLIRDATLSAGVPNFTAYATTSCTYVDTAATACTFTTNDQVIWTGTVSTDGSFVFSFSDEVTLQPGETVTLAVGSVTATASCVAQLNTREDQ